jgi:hypothetical protein
MMFGLSRPPGWEQIEEAAPSLPLDERERVVLFRFDQLVQAGYDDARATRLAEDPSVDWHEAVDLLIAGCAAPTAEAILL